MRVLIVVERGRTRRWMVRLAERLVALGGDVRVEAVEPTEPVVAGVDSLIELERLLKRRLRQSGADRIEADDVAPVADADFRPDTVIDLTARPRVRADARVLAATYDGVAGEAALLVALLEAATPIVEIVDVADGAVLERGLASLETASGFTDRIACVAARVVTLAVARIGADAAGYRRGSPPTIDRVARGGRRALPTLALRMVAASVTRAIYRLCCHTAHWRVGWRHVDGPGIAETGNFSGPAFRVLPDAGHRFFADPFPVTWEGRTFLFAEDLDHRVGRGIIAAVPFDETGPSGPPVDVLCEPWHLSYPFVFAHDGALWMIPESCNAHDVALYRCRRFPDRWERAATLIDGPSLSDATVFEENGRWWMFASLHDGDGGWSDLLTIHSAPSLFGPWSPHPGNPVMVDRTATRPAGAVWRRDGRLFRPVQDCTDGYGGALALVEITRLDEEGYE